MNERNEDNDALATMLDAVSRGERGREGQTVIVLPYRDGDPRNDLIKESATALGDVVIDHGARDL